MLFRILAFALPLLFATQAAALRCAQPLPTVWPPVGTTLSTHPFIVIDREPIQAVQLVGPTMTPGVVTRFGRFHRIMARDLLKPGATYSLERMNTHGAAKPLLYRATYDAQPVPMTWTVAQDKSKNAFWTGPIKVGKGTGFTDEWGNVSSQTLHLSYKSTAPTIAEVVLTRGTTTARLMIPVTPGKPLTFGQGHCSPGVDLVGKGTWTAAITLIGPSGQRSGTKTVTFPSPNSK